MRGSAFDEEESATDGHRFPQMKEERGGVPFVAASSFICVNLRASVANTLFASY
jgi:hypothetical protein